MTIKPLQVTTIALVLVSLVAGAVVYDRLPDTIPTHFDLAGRPDGISAKSFAVLTTPMMLLLTGLLFSVLPKIAPKGYRIEPFRRVYTIAGIALLGLEFADGMMRLGLALGYPIDINRSVSIGTGLLLVILGSFLGRVTRNFFVGVRTPWTLASPEVWRRTHRLGGALFVVGGAVTLAVGSLGAVRSPVVILPIVLAIAIFLVIYSYVLYRRIEVGDAVDHEAD